VPAPVPGLPEPPLEDDVDVGESPSSVTINGCSVPHASITAGSTHHLATFIIVILLTPVPVVSKDRTNVRARVATAVLWKHFRNCQALRPVKADFYKTVQLLHIFRWIARLSNARRRPQRYRTATHTVVVAYDYVPSGVRLRAERSEQHFDIFFGQGAAGFGFTQDRV
jgi:hypothetical protein